MRYLQLLVFFAAVIISYRFLGSSLPRVASTIAPTDVTSPDTSLPTPDNETVPTELPNE